MIHVLIIAVIDGVPGQAQEVSEQILSFAVMSGLLFLSSIYTFLM